MNKIFFALAIFASFSAHAQIDEVLYEIEQNNLTLKTLKEQAEADKLALRTGISLPDPEVELAHLWGTPATIGNRTDIALTQGFDIATVTGMKARAARRRGELVDLSAASERTAILLEAKQLCIELIYYNQLTRELDLRRRHAQEIADAYSKKIAAGDANRLELGKAQLNLATAQAEVARNETERNSIKADLARLNGGMPVVLETVRYPLVDPPADVDSLLQRNHALTLAAKNAEAARREVGLAYATGLPLFSVGYMREKTLGQHYEGVKVGMSVPLWSNRNRVKQAKAARTAAEVRAFEVDIQLREQLHALHARVAGLYAEEALYRRTLTEAADADLLKKALDAGEISLLDYLTELTLYYDASTRALEARRDLHLAHAALTAAEL